jgi:hypothetical protein
MKLYGLAPTRTIRALWMARELDQQMYARPKAPQRIAQAFASQR